MLSTTRLALSGLPRAHRQTNDRATRAPPPRTAIAVGVGASACASRRLQPRARSDLNTGVFTGSGAPPRMR
jgi:hypothetical protein